MYIAGFHLVELVVIFVHWPPISIHYIVGNVQSKTASKMMFLCNKFYYILTSLVKYVPLNDTGFAPWLVRPHPFRPHELILNFLF